MDSAPGSATDVALRVVAERLSRIWNQQVVALNNPGAGGSIAARVAAQSPNDGYTLSFAAASTFTALAGAPGVPANLPIQVPRDFLPIGFVSVQPMFLAASPKSGINSISDLIEQAKKRPGEINYGSAGLGTNPANARRAIESLEAEIRRIRAGGVTRREVDEAVAYLTGRFPLRLETSAGLADVLWSMEFYALGDDYLDRYADYYRTVTVEQVNEAARRHLHPDRATLVLSGSVPDGPIRP